MIPLRDENPSGTVPVVTRLLIVVNCVVFLYEILLGPELREFMLQWGMVPRRIAEAFSVGSEPLTVALVTPLTSMFLHGGWAHLLGNMWYLWIFGDNIEDRFGSWRFSIFYVVAGFFAAYVHFALNPGSVLPTVGASGAIAAVLGAYMVTYPRARVVTLVPLFPFFQVMALPAVFVLGFWFVFQFFTGALSLAWSTKGGGIAWGAHVGGFVFGWIAARLLAPRRAGPRWIDRATMR